MFSSSFQILDFPPEDNMLDVLFYGDRTKAKVYRTTVMPFDEGASLFVEGKRELLNKAVKEALIDMQSMRR